MNSLKAIPETDSDEVLLQVYKSSRKQELLASLYLKYSDLVYGTALKYLKDQESAKDAVMNIYQELVEKLLEHQVNNFKSWLFVLTRNHCLMQIRKHKNIRFVDFEPSDMQFAESSHPDIDLEKESNLVKLENCIKNLNLDQKDVVTMFYLKNKCYNEIAEITGFDWNRVRSLVQNGRRNLKNCMEKNG